MTDIRLTKPQAGQRVEIPSPESARLVFEFNPSESIMDRAENDLEFRFEDGSVVVVKDFYAEYTKENLPDFVVQGDVITGEAFFAALSEELQPAAGPSATATRGGRFHDYNDANLMGGIDRLSGLDQEHSGGAGSGDDQFGGIASMGSSGYVEPNVAPQFNEPEGAQTFGLREAGVGVGDDPNAPFSGVNVAEGRINAYDRNKGDSITFSLQGESCSTEGLNPSDYGTFVLNPDGTFRFELNNDSAATNNLIAGDTVTLTFVVGIRDSRGATTGETRTITVNISGTNDRPEITEFFYKDADGVEHSVAADASGGFVHGGFVKEGGIDGKGLTVDTVEGRYTLEGSITMDDADRDDDHTTLQVGVSNGREESWSNKDAEGADRGHAEIKGQYGTLTLNADGTYSYTVNESDINSLHAGEKTHDTFIIYVRDKHGATTAKEVTFNIEGTNDIPKIDSVSNTIASEGGLTHQDTIHEKAEGGLGGEIKVSDEDNDDSSTSLELGVSAGRTPTDGKLDNVEWSGRGQLDSTEGRADTISANGTYGKLTIDANGNYEYTLNNDDPTVKALKEGEDASETFTIYVRDAQGAIVAREVTFNIKGTNDAPQISENVHHDVQFIESGVVTSTDGTTTKVEGGLSSAEVTVDGVREETGAVSGSRSFTGKLHGSDADVDHKLTYFFTDANGNELPSPMQLVYEYVDDNGVAQKAVIGEVTLNGDGTYTATLFDDAANPLPEGKTISQEFSVGVRDEYGAVADNTETIKVSITGTNDAPTITEASSVITLTESGVVTKDGTTSEVKGGVESNVTVDGSNESKSAAEGEFSYTGKLHGHDVDTGHTLTYCFVEDGAVATTKDANGNEVLTTTKSISYTYTAADGSIVTVDVATVTLNPDGTYTVKLLDSAADVMSQGDSISVKIDVGVRDEKGAFAKDGDNYQTETIEVNIKGTNDKPELVLTPEGGKDFAFVEDGATTSLSGKVSITDVDSDGDVQTISITGEGKHVGPAGENTPGAAGTQAVYETEYGTLTVDPATGTYTYVLKGGEDGDKNSAVQRLGEGQTYTETFYVTTTDKWGATDTKPITVTITGTNDKPVLTPSEDQLLTVKDDGYINGNSYTSGKQTDTSGKINATDVDDGDTVQFYFKGEGGTTGETMYVVSDGEGGYKLVTSCDPNSHLGKLTVNNDVNSPNYGKVTFELNRNNSQVNTLNPEESININGVPVYASDGKLEADDAQNINIRIDGTNDKPILVLEPDGGKNFAFVEDGATTSLSGKMTITDVDSDGSIQTISISGRGHVGPAGENTPGVAGAKAVYETQYGTLTVDPATGTYTYVLKGGEDGDKNSAVQRLGEGQTYTETFYVTTTDKWGATDTKPITVTITGTNDQPVLTPREGQVITVKEAGYVGDSYTSGKQYGTSDKIDATDVDQGDRLQFYFKGEDGAASAKMYVVSDGEGGYKLVSSCEYNTNLGTLTVNNNVNSPNYGKVTFELNNNNKQVNSLNPEQSIDIKDIPVYASDGRLEASDSQNIDIRIEGTNDKPVLTLVQGGKHDYTDTLGLKDASATEDYRVEATGSLKATDVDDGDTKTYKITFDGKVYTVSPEDAADGLTIETPYGKITFEFKPDGTINYKYSIESSIDGKIHTLDQGQTAEEKFTVQVEDKWGTNSDKKDITIKLTGDNDAPIVREEQADSWSTSVTEDRGLDRTEGDAGFERTISADGKLEAFDAEGHKLTFALVDGENQNGPMRSMTHYLEDENGDKVLIDGKPVEIGYITLRPDGTYTYTLFNDSPYVQGMPPDQTIVAKFWVRVDDGHGGVMWKQITVDVKGADDSPEIIRSRDTIYEDGGHVTDASAGVEVKGNITFADIDRGDISLKETNDNVTVSLNGKVDGEQKTVESFTTDEGSFTRVVGKYGTLTVKSDGSYTYTLHDDVNNSDELQGAYKDELFARENFGFTVSTGESHNGKSVEGNFVLDIKGSNDAPVITHEVHGTTPVAQTFDVVRTDCQETGVIKATDIDESRGHDEGLTFRIMHKYDDSDNPTDATFNDVDGQSTKVGEGWQAEQTIQGKYGTLTINPDGTYTYTLNIFSKELDNVKPGEILVETGFRVTVTDRYGATHTVDLPISHEMPDIRGGGGDDPGIIHPSDPHSFTVTTDSLTVKEDRSVAASGEVKVECTSHTGCKPLFAFKTESGEYVQSISDKYGTLTIDPVTGKYTYTLNNSSKYVQELPEGYEVPLPDHTVHLVDRNGNPYRDANGNPVTSNIGVTVEGTNDAPVVDSVDTISVSAGQVTDDGNRVKAHDIDKDLLDRDGDGNTNEQEPLTYTFTYNGVVIAPGTSVTTKLGTFTLNLDGTYTYTLNPNSDQYKALADGSIVRDSGFAVTVSDGVESVSKPIDVKITGINDAPTLSIGDASGDAVPDNAFALKEDGTTSIKGTALGKDVDQGDTLRYSMESGGQSSSYILTGKYGTVVLNPTTGKFEYILNNESATVQGLGSGESLTETVTFYVTDSKGETVKQDVTFTVNGTDDAAEVTWTGETTLTIREDATQSPTTIGKVSITDIDKNDYQTITGKFAGGGEETIKYDASGDGTIVIPGKYGNLIIKADGTYSYVPTSNELGANERATETFTLQVNEYNSAGQLQENGQTAKEINVTVNGKNDAPTFTEGDWQQTFSEDSGPISGSVKAADPDLSDQGKLQFFIMSGGRLVTQLTTSQGTLSIDKDGNYTFTPNNDAFQYLNDGQSADVKYTVVVKDPSGATASHDLNFTVTGSNDAPVFSGGTWTRTLSEDSGAISDTIKATDADRNDQGKLEFFIRDENGDVQALSSEQGTLTIDNNGKYVFTPNNEYFQHLKDGESATVKYTIVVKDPSGAESSKELTFNVTGVNDAPVIQAEESVLVLHMTKDDASAAGAIKATDVDNAPSELQYNFVQDGTVAATMEGKYGTITIDSNGNYTYAVDATKIAAALETMGEDFFNKPFAESFTVRVSDGSLHADQKITIELDQFKDAIKAGADGLLQGTDGNDLLLGDSAANVLYGDGGDDILYGGGGDDYLDGGEGANRLYGGEGNDILKYSALNEIMDGGEGGVDFLVGLTNVDNLDALLDSSAIKNIEAFVFNGDKAITSLSELEQMGVTVSDNAVSFGEGWRPKEVDEHNEPVSHRGYVIMEYGSEEDGTALQIAVQQALLNEGNV